MNDNQLPDLSIDADADLTARDESIERVDWSEATPEGTLAETGPLDVGAWSDIARELAETTQRLTVCSVLIRRHGKPDDAPMGREAMTQMARAIQGAHAPEEGVAVDGDDRLLLVLPPDESWGAIATTIERAVAQGGESPAQVRASFGLAEVGSLGQGLDDALRLARTAAVHADQNQLGAEIMTLADEALQSRDETVAAALTKALDEGSGLRLVFQPKINTGSQVVVGAEALLRFGAPELGPIGPSEFIPIAERMGLLGRLESWVVETAVVRIASMVENDGLALPVSINVRGADLLESGFVEKVGALLDQHGVDPSMLMVEVSEADVLSNLDAAEERLGALRAIGVQVALDDFGKEGATLADLRRLPIDVLKVHRAFIRGMESDDSISVLIQGVMSLARVLGIRTVAAGVENWSQFDSLKAIGCGAVQGYLFSVPLEERKFIEHLETTSQPKRDAA